MVADKATTIPLNLSLPFPPSSSLPPSLVLVCGGERERQAQIRAGQQGGLEEELEVGGHRKGGRVRGREAGTEGRRTCA